MREGDKLDIMEQELSSVSLSLLVQLLCLGEKLMKECDSIMLSFWKNKEVTFGSMPSSYWSGNAMSGSTL